MHKQYLDPEYLDTDFQTVKKRLSDLMQQSDTFWDYNYDGSNITMLIELIAYLTELSTYYSNKIVKNLYPDSAELFETMHSIASIRGYRTKGYIAPQLNLKVKVLVNDDESKLPSSDDQIVVPAWFRINSGIETDDGDPIEYTTTKEYTFTIPSTAADEGEFEFELPMKQGQYYDISFFGSDIVDNKLLLPSINIDYDTQPYDENPSLQLYVNSDPWERVENFPYSELNYGENDKIFVLEYDKYERYNIIFSPAHEVPSDTDTIQIILNETAGPDGDIYSDFIKDFENERTVAEIDESNDEVDHVTKSFIYDITRDFAIDKDYIEIENPESSYNSADPETIDEIEENSRGFIYSQLRNITPTDYKNHLEEHPDIVTGLAWGEAEENPGNPEEYNKIYVSMIPKKWGTSTIEISATSDSVETSATTWHREDVFDEPKSIEIPTEYSESFEQDILAHLEPRKYINIYEELVVPEIVNFAFDIGIKTRRTYNFTTVKEEVKRKLEYFFRMENRKFHEVIDFKEVENYIMDNEVRDDDGKRFSLTKGVLNFVIRDILTYTPTLDDPEKVYEPNEDNNYPMYTVEDWEYDYTNTLRPIKLGFKQFPVLISENCTFISEE